MRKLRRVYLPAAAVHNVKMTRSFIFSADELQNCNRKLLDQVCVTTVTKHKNPEREVKFDCCSDTSTFAPAQFYKSSATSHTSDNPPGATINDAICRFRNGPDGKIHGVSREVAPRVWFVYKRVRVHV